MNSNFSRAGNKWDICTILFLDCIHALPCIQNSPIRQLNVNLETITAMNNSDKILSIPEVQDLYGVTVGRVDLVSSMGKDRSYVNSDEVYKLAKQEKAEIGEEGGLGWRWGRGAKPILQVCVKG